MRQMFNEGWEFLKMPIDSSMEEMRNQEHNFAGVDIPHDWLIYDTQNLYEDGRGWYRKIVTIPKEVNEHVFLYFEGVYMDTQIFINGKKAWEWKYGYSSFEVEITEFLTGREEEILVSVSHKGPNSRWYSGAGIYRDVWIKKVPETYIVTDSLYVSQKKQGNKWQVTVEVEVDGAAAASMPCIFTIKKDEKEICSVDTKSHTAVMEIIDPILWDLDNPELYEMEVVLLNGEKETVKFGFKTVEFTTDKGFFLNGKFVKMQGVCEHHDLGCLGAAYSSVAMRRKLVKLKEMGVNALRTAHNMPAPDLMDLTDEMGILVISEGFDMWERPKTTYDYARFFIDWAEKDVASWVRRDRNHASLVMWSIGNEIYDTHASEHGQDIMRRLKKYVEDNDKYGNAIITFGSNFLPWENTQKCGDILKVVGYNYGEKYYAAHHEKYPDWVIYGSETASVVHSRGIYHFPLSKQLLAEDDEQCSALGNSTTSWGADSIEKCITDDRDTKYSLGQFIWTGFDYIGEPTPYHTKNSYFGQIDTAGFPKDAFYTFQAEWTDYKKAPMIHVFPYWDFNPGQMIDVRVCSNAPEVELFMNGKSLGKRAINHVDGLQLIQDWQIPYVEGEIKALAYDENGNVIASESRCSFGDSEQIVLKADKTSLQADGRDMVFVEISTTDINGNPVENAVDLVEVSVTGAARLVGLDNGDSTDYDSYKGTCRRLFSGKLLAVIAAKKNAGEVKVKVTGKNLKEAELVLHAVEAKVAQGICATEENKKTESFFNEDIWIRKISISAKEGMVFSPDKRQIEVQADIYPKNATYTNLVWSAVTEAGIASPLATVDAKGNCALITAKADGEFRVRCTADNGTGKVRVISGLEFRAEGLGKPFLNPYEFISGGLYDCCVGDVGNGNEKGVSTARDGQTQVGFRDVDFGDFGSDEITMPIFALSDDSYKIEIWENMPGEEGSQMVDEVIYQKPSIWNVYQPETWKLSKRLKGVTTLCFVLYQKVHIKGFSFSKIEKAFSKSFASDCDHLYGDSFKVVGDCVENIGNNVTLEYAEMNFGEEGTSEITICGKTPLPNNTIHIRISENGQSKVQIIEFPQEDAYTEHSFKLETITGTKKVELVFLPGSNFDLHWFKFE